MRQLSKLQLSVIALLMVVGVEASAQSKKGAATAPATPAAAATPSANSDKVDVTDIENKYWASKDTDFSVVQNRLFPKEKRFSLSFAAGPLVADPNSDGLFYALDASYYFSERWGVALTYGVADLQDNKSVKSLTESYGARPDHNKTHNFYGVSALYVPIYAKASVLNSKIVYFDFAIAPGIGLQEYVQQLDSGNIKKTAPALTLDITQQFFFSNHFAVRADYRHRFYQENIGRHSSSLGSRLFHNESAHDQILTFGATFYF